MIQVTAAIICQNNKYLICKRKPSDSCPNLWEFPGGKLEEGETLVECLSREIKEELNLVVKIKGIFAETYYEYPEKKISFTFYIAEIISGKMVLRVHKSAKWVSPEELKQYKFCPADIEIVERLINEQKDLQ